MLDISRIRKEKDLIKQGMTDKGEKDVHLVDEVIETDQKWRDATHRLDLLRNENNTKSKQIGVLMGQGKKDEARNIIEETGNMKTEIQSLEEEMKSLQTARTNLLMRIPNMAHSSVPVGNTENDNEVIKTHGETLEKSWRKPHWEITDENGWIDFKRGVKVSAGGFPFYVGPVARLQRALINFFIDRGIDNGYIELQAPYFVNEDSARGTGQIPDKEDMMYVVPRDNYFAIPTAEVPVTNFHRDEIFGEKDLPVKYVCHTPCWRREAGSYGSDVRGLNRLHQFDKVELVKFVKPDQSYDELETLRKNAEGLIEELGLSYRTLLMCTGDMGFTQSKKYDLEVWSPGQSRWLEVSSCSNFEDYQARRMMIRYRNEKSDINILHTLNGSGLALPRILSAVLEQYQEESGNIKVPEVLQQYTGRDYL
ncbi:MAG: serine--tRNA ligase [Balneolales bacterium]